MSFGLSHPVPKHQGNLIQLTWSYFYFQHFHFSSVTALNFTLLKSFIIFLLGKSIVFMLAMYLFSKQENDLLNVKL